MKYKIEEREYEVVIKKSNNKNTYIRIKEDLKIYVSTNYFSSNKYIKSLLDNNISYLKKVIKKREEQIKRDNDFYYLGNKYDIILVSTLNNVDIVNNKIYVKNEKELQKWYHNQIREIFEMHLQINYNLFEENIPYPKLKIRDMKTRWGVCNRKNTTITLNSNLIKYDLNKLDYVIIHELSHFVHFNHSNQFWSLVFKYCKQYKKIRKELRE